MPAQSISSDCLVTFEPWWWDGSVSLLDVTFSASFGMLPTFLTRLISLFIYAYTFSMGLKVYLHARAIQGRRQAKESLEDFRVWSPAHDAVPASSRELRDPTLQSALEEAIKTNQKEAKGKPLTAFEYAKYNDDAVLQDFVSAGGGASGAAEAACWIKAGGLVFQPASLDTLFKMELREAKQPFLFASFHYFIAYGCLFFSVLNGVVLGPMSLTVGVPYLPVSAAYAYFVYLAYAFGKHYLANWNETRPKLREYTFWFADLGRYQPQFLQAISFPGFFIGHFLHAATAGAQTSKSDAADPEANGGAKPGIGTYLKTVFKQPANQGIGSMWEAGQGGASDAGFLTLAFGFQTFWASLAVAPVLCTGLWLNLATVTGTMELTDRSSYIFAEWRQVVSGVAGILRFDLSFLADIQLFGLSPLDAFESIVGLITGFKEEGLRMLLDLIWPLLQSMQEWRNLDVNILELLRAGTTALLAFNVFLNIVKPLSVMLLLAYTAAQKRCSNANLFTTVKFGECIPDADTLERAKKRDELLRELVKRLDSLLTVSPVHLDIKDAKRVLKEADRFKDSMMIAGRESELERWISRSESTQALVKSLPGEIVSKSDALLRDQEMRAENARLADEAADELAEMSPSKKNKDHLEKAHKREQERQATLDEARRLHFDAGAMADDFTKGRLDAKTNKRFREVLDKLGIDIDAKLAQAEKASASQ